MDMRTECVCGHMRVQHFAGGAWCSHSDCGVRLDQEKSKAKGSEVLDKSSMKCSKFTEAVTP